MYFARWSMLCALVACNTGTHLASSVQAIVELPANSDFGAVQIGQTATNTFTIVPASGLQSDTVETVDASSCSDFTVDAEGLPAAVFTQCDGTAGGQAYGCASFTTQTYSFQATFHPAIQQPVTCVVQLVIDGGARSLTLTGTGVAPPIVVNVTPAVDFGDVRRNHDSSPGSVVIANDGSGTMAVASVTIDQPVFTVTSGIVGPHAIGASSRETDGVTCHPTTLGPNTATLSVATDDPMTAMTATALSCNGIDSNLDLPSPIQLPTIRVGDTITQTITLLDDGTAPMQIEGASVTDNPDLTITVPPNTLSMLPVAGTTMLTLQYAPTVATTDFIGTLVVTYDGGQSRPTKVRGNALATHLSLDPDGKVDFGPICLGSSTTKEFRVVANLPGGFAVDSIALAPPFTIAAGPGNVLPATGAPVPVLGGGVGALVFEITAAPTDPGRVSTTLEIGTDIPMTPAHSTVLTASGISGGVSTTPQVVNFGTPMAGVQSEGKDVIVTNCTAAPLALGDATIVDDPDGDFIIVATPPATSIAPGTSATYTVAMSARFNGVKLASLVLAYTDGSAAIPLAGTAIGGPDVPTSSRETYYACSVGDARSCWLLAAAIALTLRRRRR